MSPCRLLLGIALSALAFAAAPDGAAIYKQRCAMCHDHPTERIPARDTLAKGTPESVFISLTTGAMRQQGEALTEDERRAVAAFVTAKDFGTAGSIAAQPSSNRCAVPPTPLSLSDADWNGWGHDLENTRFHPKPGIKAGDVSKLKVKWAFGYANLRFTYGQPTVVGDRLYVTSGNGTLYALDANTGCVYWTIDAGTAARTAVSVGPAPANSGGRYAVYFGDEKAVVHAVNADTGAEVWKTKVDDHPVGRITGAPILHKDKLYVPVSSIEEVSGMNVKYECCKFRGSVVALDAGTGKQLWKTYTITDPPKPFRTSSAGTQMYGPAGAAVWSSPTIDLKRKLVYIGTGNSYTDVETRTANAILAIDMDTGSLKWSNQATPKDNFLVGCMKPGAGNCPQEAGPDVDFGSSPILRSIGGKKSIVLAGQKSGAVFGLDPDNLGRTVWQQKIGEGSALGGVEWGFAADTENAYVAIADSVTPRDKAKPGIAALKIATGERLWFTPAPNAGCTWGTTRCLPAQSQAVTAIPGAVFSGSMDGHLRAYSAKDGSIIWDFDTGRPFDTVNGVKATGGSLDAAGPTVARGMVFVNSGYGRIVGQGGNVLLAFSVDGK
jgi:polyvinyl alcohol dehydrogenase (cytochrome)